MIRSITMIGLAIATLQLVAVMGNNIESSKNFVNAEFISRKINDFSFDLIREFRREKQNWAVSPISVWTVLSMASLGSDSSTRSELLRGLHLNNVPFNVSLPGIKELINGLNVKPVIQKNSLIHENNIENDYFPGSITHPPAAPVELHLTSKIFVRDGLTIKNEFKKELESYDIASLESVNFENAQAASETVNNWIAQQTNSRINKIIDPTEIDKQTAMVLVNTLYFKGAWKTHFAQYQTKLRDFHLQDKTIKKVLMMYTDAYFNYGMIPKLNSSFIKLPFKTPSGRETVSMFVIIPDNIADLENVEHNIKNIWLSDLETGIESRLELYLPKFKIETTINLRSSLKNLKMKNIFESSANFSRITDSPLKVTNIIQKVFIDVNEKGVEASAAAGMLVATLSAPPVVRVDKPFLFLICTEKVILFSGKIVDPTQQQSIILQ